jgi:hypothetical protein
MENFAALFGAKTPEAKAACFAVAEFLRLQFDIATRKS